MLHTDSNLLIYSSILYGLVASSILRSSVPPAKNPQSFCHAAVQCNSFSIRAIQFLSLETGSAPTLAPNLLLIG